jgi:hypothetical protein
MGESPSATQGISRYVVCVVTDLTSLMAPKRIAGNNRKFGQCPKKSIEEHSR